MLRVRHCNRLVVMLVLLVAVKCEQHDITWTVNGVAAYNSLE